MKNIVFEKTNTRFEYIDALRGFAILGVILTHVGSLINLNGHARHLSNIGGMGVDLFFVISAFTIFHMFSKHITQESHPIRDFFIRRLFRIVPVYWFGIILYTLVFGFSSRGWLPGPKLWHYPYHAFLVNLLHPEVQSSVVPGGWSISGEVIFYLSVPILYKLIRSLKSAYFFSLLSIFVLPVFTFLIKKTIMPYFVNIDPKLLQLYWSRFPLNLFGCFSLGILLFYALRIVPLINFLKNKIANILSVTTICLLILLLSFANAPFPLKTHMYCVLFLFLALCLSVKPLRFFVNPFTVFVGRISYSGYLFHFIIIYFLVKLCKSYYPNLFVNQYLAFIILSMLGISFTIPFAFLGYSLIEQPAINKSKHLITALDEKRNV